MRRLTTALAVIAVGLAIVIVLSVIRRDPPIAPVRSPPAIDSCRGTGTSDSGEVDLIARHAACEAACTTGDMPTCGLAATDYVTGLGAPPDGARAAELYEKACASRKAPSACLLLGDLYGDSSLIPHDDERAKHAWSRGCAQQDHASCTRLDGGQLKTED